VPHTIDFLDVTPEKKSRTEGSPGNKPASIYRGNLFETPASRASSTLDEKTALLEGDIELTEIKKGKEEISSATSRSSSPASSIDSIIARTPKSALLATGNNKLTILTPPQSASTNNELSSTPVTTKTSNKNIFSGLAQRLSSDNKASLDNLDNTGTRFTPNMRDKTNQQRSKEVQISVSRRSLVIHNSGSKRTNSESGHEQDAAGLPPHYQNSKRASVVSSTSSIMMTNSHNRSIDFGLAKTGIDDLIHSELKDDSSSVNINQSQHSLNQSLSNIYMQALYEKKQKAEAEKLAKQNKTKGINAEMVELNVSLNPAGQSAGKTSLGGARTYETGSMDTLGSEKSCY
jgi:hypothetical protein